MAAAIAMRWSEYVRTTASCGLPPVIVMQSCVAEHSIPKASKKSAKDKFLDYFTTTEDDSEDDDEEYYDDVDDEDEDIDFIDI